MAARSRGRHLKMCMDAMQASGRDDVAIIGGGVIGLAIACELARRGVRVTVLDKGEPGHGCSFGNAGWLTPSLAMPLPRPGMLLKAMGWLLDPESPLYIKPRPSPFLAGWLLRFIRSMNQAHLLRSLEALAWLTRTSLDALARLEEETGHPTAFERNGLLVAAQTDAGLAGARRDMELVGRFGIPGRALGEAELRSFEPALTGSIRGGVFYPDDAQAEPYEVVRAYMKGAIAHGARILPSHEVHSFRVEGRRLVAVETTRGTFESGRFVLATGSWSRAVGRRLGLSIPVLGGKGYALIVPPLEPQPLRPILLLEKKVAVTPRRDSLRLAGTMEIVDGDDSITARRVGAIVKGARSFLNVPDDLVVRELWRGLRPCTPDGLPVIGFSPLHENLLIATGHQMVGLKAAPATARLAADLLLGEKPPFDPDIFRADRF